MNPGETHILKPYHIKRQINHVLSDGAQISNDTFKMWGEKMGTGMLWEMFCFSAILGMEPRALCKCSTATCPAQNKGCKFLA